jgi:acetyl esterase/lipase
VLFPQPVADIVCAVDYAADRARRAGYRAAPLVVLGHSSGAHLASLAALAGTHFRERCPYPPAQPDGLVGLAGPYDITAFSEGVRSLFGASQVQAPAAWHEGSPYTWVRSRPGLAVLLAAGDHDDLVAPGFSMAFAAALRAAGHRVRLDIVPGATHFDIYTPGVIASTVAAWIATAKPG